MLVGFIACAFPEYATDTDQTQGPGDSTGTDDSRLTQTTETTPQDTGKPGDTGDTSTTPPILTRRQTVAAADRATCTIREDATLDCSWIFLNDLEAPQGTFASVDGWGYHFCGIRTEGTLECWVSEKLQPLEPPSGTFSSISVGEHHACGLRADGEAVCWGDDSEGQSHPPPLMFQQVDAGTGTSCGLTTDGSALCWGADENDIVSTVPEGQFTQLAIAPRFVCAIAENTGAIHCWGDLNHGNTLSNAPAKGTFIDIDANHFHYCARESDGKTTCWGDNAPIDIGEDDMLEWELFQEVSVGRTHSCGVNTRDELVCWGEEWW